MAERIKALPKLGRSREPKYDLEQFMDGSTVVLVRGTKDEVKSGKADFDCELGSMRANLYRAGKQANRKVVSRFIPDYKGREAIAFEAHENGAQAQTQEQTRKPASTK